MMTTVTTETSTNFEQHTEPLDHNVETDAPRKYTLYEMRKISGKSGATVAKLCNTTYHSLRNWEKGITIPNVVVTQDLLQLYGFSFNQLDLTPFYNGVIEKNRKQKEQIQKEDNPERELKQYEEQLKHLST